jgi:hypothetical protein
VLIHDAEVVCWLSPAEARALASDLAAMAEVCQARHPSQGVAP